MREVVRLRHLQVSPERDEPGDDDDNNDDDLDDPQDVQQAQPPAQLRAVQDERERQARPADQARLPVVLARVRDVARGEQVVPKDDGVAGRPAEQDTVRGVERGDEVFRPADEVFEVVLFPSVAREGLEGGNDPSVGRSLLDREEDAIYRAPNDVYPHPCRSDDGTDDPHEAADMLEQIHNPLVPGSTHRARPTLPLSARIVLGVEKMLCNDTH